MVREASGSGTLGSKFDGGGSLSGDADGDGSLSSGSLDGSGDTSGQLSGDSVGSLSGVSNEFLVFDSSGNIVTSGYTSGDFAPATHFHPASDITSGTFADARISESSVLQHESAINHDNLLNVGVNSHGQIDSHIGDNSIHFTESSIDHNNIQNIGNNSHADIDNHISDGTIHYTKGSIGLSEIGENISSPSDREVVIYNGGNSDFENRLLVEADIPSLSAGKITTGTFNDARIAQSSVFQFVDDTASNLNTLLTSSEIDSRIGSNIGSTDLGDLNNVTETNSAIGEFIRYDGSNWINTLLSASDIPNLDASKITTGQFADARISESSVTQHQGALMIDASTQLNNNVPYGNLPFTSTDVSNWNTAYDERGSQIAGTNLTWNGTQLDATDTNTQLNVGAENQIPFVNSSGSDLEYSSDLRWDDTSLLVGGNVDVSNKIILAPISNPTYAEGQLWYSADTTTLNFQNDRSGVTLNIGEETWLRVRNNSGSDISDGSAVYINGFDTGPGLPTVELAQANSATTADMVGLATETIANNASGMITTYGLVREVDTSAYSAGDTLYLSPSTPGALTTTEPGSPNFSVRVGKVSRSNVGGGQILVGVSDIREAIYTQGSIPYANADGRLIDDNTNLSWDGTDIFVGGNAVWHAGDFTSTDISNWNTAYSERGSQIDGTLLNWSGTQLDVQESSIDHNNLTNTHNLTTDIDHNQLTNYASNEHRVWENSITQNIHEDNITQASITQHESALTITESQITDGSILARVGSDETITGTWDFDTGNFETLQFSRGAGNYGILGFNGNAYLGLRDSNDDPLSLFELHGTTGEASIRRTAGGDTTFRKLWHEADFDNPFPNGGDQAVGSSDNVDFNNGNFAGDVVITGDLTVNGTEFITNTETVEIEDNLAILNSGESGSGISAGFAGWEADRGTLTNYQWGFDETRDLWVIGEKGTTLQAVATRQDSPTNNALAFWNSTDMLFETDSNLTWDGTDLSIGGSNAIVVGDNVSDLNNDGEYVPKSGGTFDGTLVADGVPAYEIRNSANTTDYAILSISSEASFWVINDSSGNTLGLIRQNSDNGEVDIRRDAGGDSTLRRAWHDGNVSTGSNIDITGRTISLTGTIPESNLPNLAGTGLNWDGTDLNVTGLTTSEIASGSKTGIDTQLVTGTAGTSGNFSQWNADGDLVDSGIAVSSYNNSNWDTAYSWGDHSTQGYLTSVDWGDIGGTLSDQTDLQSALDAKVESPAGSNSHVQYNDGGSFGASNNMVFDDNNLFFGVNVNPHSTIHSGACFAMGETYSPDITEGDNTVPLDETVGFLKVFNQNSGVDVIINLPDVNQVPGRVYLISVENTNGANIVLNAGSGGINGTGSVTLNNTPEFRLHKVFPVVAGVTGWSV